MKRKKVMLLLAAASAAAIASMSAVSAEENTGLVQIENETEADETDEALADETEADEADAALEDETEVETEEDEDAYLEGAAVLSDFGYEPGEMTEDAWESEFFNMTYVPSDGISMGLEENGQLAGYYLRHGDDKQVAASEMVAIDEEEDYVQLMAEVNPNAEEAEDILARFTEKENLNLPSDPTVITIADKDFLTCTGVVDSDRYMLGVCTDEENFVLALKVKYENTASRKALLKGFDVLEEGVVEAVSVAGDLEDMDILEEAENMEAYSEADSEEEVSMPSEFEDFTVIEPDTESGEAIE